MDVIFFLFLWEVMGWCIDGGGIRRCKTNLLDRYNRCRGVVRRTVVAFYACSKETQPVSSFNVHHCSMRTGWCSLQCNCPIPVQNCHCCQQTNLNPLKVSFYLHASVLCRDTSKQ
uniref:Putative secreted protein n=1 Tax=Amblyomma tuberculatum TaxID=48802 RepID=A0A6M2E4U7_9ACAR